MVDFQGPRCETCKYFYPEDGDDKSGVCRRFPPHVVATIKGLPDKPQGEPEYNFRSVFPPMLRTGWCGEHQAH